MVQPNIKVDKMCQLKYKNKVMSHNYPCNVTEFNKSKDGVFRTVKIMLGNKKALGMKLLPCEEMEVDVQCLVLIEPAKTKENQA